MTQDIKLELLNQIDQFTDKAHGSQLRKYLPDRYIVHPRRVMQICQKVSDHLPTLATALLHDVLEDTSVRPHEIKDFLISIFKQANILAPQQLADEILSLVIELTDVYEKAVYPQLNRTQRKTLERKRMQGISPKAQTIKYADIMDNAAEIVQYDKAFAPKFLSECRELLAVMNQGDPTLYELAQRATQFHQHK